jgi:hypothetical protein
MLEKGSRSIGQKKPSPPEGAHQPDKCIHMLEEGILVTGPFMTYAIIGQWEFSERIAAAS